MIEELEQWPASGWRSRKSFLQSALVAVVRLLSAVGLLLALLCAFAP